MTDSAGETPHPTPRETASSDHETGLPNPAPSDPGDETVELAPPSAEPRGLRSRLRHRLKRHESERVESQPSGQSARYTHLHELGRGGMGAVWEVEDTKLGRRVALKTTLGDDPTMLVRFRREARLAAQLEHPNIVPVYDTEEREGGGLSLSMRLVEGRSLRQVLEDLTQGKGELGQARVLEIVTAVGQALSYAHAQGVIHRDIKPANIMLGRFGQVFLTDFGLAKRIGEDDTHTSSLGGEGESQVSQEGLVVGTPAYMAPEQAAGHTAAVDAQTDVYALGAVLYELLTLTRPFSGAKGQALLNAIQTVEPQPPRRRAPLRAIPRELGAIALKALAKPKAERYASVEALLTDVRAFQEGRAVSASPDPLLVWVRKWAQRHSLLVATALTALVVTGIAGASLLVWRSQAAAETAALRSKAQSAELKQLRVETAELERLKRREAATAPYLTGLDLLNRRLDVATIASQAVPPLEAAVALDPEFAEARFTLGLAYLRSFQNDKAFLQVHKALDQQPTNAHWLVQLGNMYQRSLSPRHAEAAQTQAVAREYFERAAAVGDSAGPFAKIGRALVHADSDEPEQARTLLREVTTRAPYLWEGWHALGYAELRADPAAAEVAFRQALELEPDEAAALRGVAAALNGQQKYAEALPYSERAAELADPEEGIDLMNLGHTLFQLRRYDEAIVALEEAARRTPENPRPHMTLGATYQALNRPDEALAAFDEAIERDDGSVAGDLYEGRGSVRIGQGLVEEALSDFEIAVARSPELAQNWANRAFAHMRLRNLEAAQSDLDKALDLDPTLGSAWANLAGIREALGDKTGALEALDQGIEHEPDNGQLWVFRGQFKLMAGHTQEAISDLEQAFEVGGSQGLPLQPEARIMLLRAYRRVGQPAKVLATIEAQTVDLPPRLQRLLEGEAGLAHFAIAQALCQEHKYPQALEHLRSSNRLEPQTGNAMLAAQVAAQVGELDEAVDRAGDQFLAGTGFTLDQYRCIGRSDSLNL